MNGDHFSQLQPLIYHCTFQVSHQLAANPSHTHILLSNMRMGFQFLTPTKILSFESIEKHLMDFLRYAVLKLKLTFSILITLLHPVHHVFGSYLDYQSSIRR